MPIANETVTMYPFIGAENLVFVHADARLPHGFVEAACNNNLSIIDIIYEKHYSFAHRTEISRIRIIVEWSYWLQDSSFHHENKDRLVETRMENTCSNDCVT